jgi:colanic acid/amylovoran biosynthesis glycosyltransferase
VSRALTRVAYLTSRYPHVSHTFIEREVSGLRTLGLSVLTCSVHRTVPADQLSDADRAAAASTVVLRDRGAFGTAWDNCLTLVARPVTYVKAAVLAVVGGPPGLKARTWQLFYLAQAASMWRICRRADIRHVHAHFANNAADIARLTAVLGSTENDPWTWSFTMHGPTEFLDVSAFGLARKAREATFVCCISDFARGQLMGLVTPRRWPSLHVVHCGVDVAEYSPVERASRTGCLRVLTIGRLVPEKGLGVLIDAVAELGRSGTSVEVTVVGDGTLRQQWMDRAQARGVGDSIRFVGALGRDEVRRWFDWADVFCLTSFAEGVPVVLMEAMACGLPVVSTRIAGIPELVEDGTAGVLVPPGRPDLVAAALRLLAPDPGLRTEMGLAGRRAVAERYSVHEEAERLAALFHAQAAQLDGQASRHSLK